MFKRQQYNVFHGSSSSSSSSDDSVLSQDLQDDAESPASSHETSEVEEASTDEEQLISKKKRKSSTKNDWAEIVEDTEREKLDDSMAIQMKGVFKCRLCPKVVCLSESSIEAHFQSKGHARCLKKFEAGKIKAILNSEGEEEEMESDGETHAERYARTMAALEDSKNSVTKKKRKRDSGRQRQRKRAQRKALPENKEKITGKQKVRKENRMGAAGKVNKIKIKDKKG